MTSAKKNADQVPTPPGLASIVERFAVDAPLSDVELQVLAWCASRVLDPDQTVVEPGVQELFRQRHCRTIPPQQDVRETMRALAGLSPGDQIRVQMGPQGAQFILRQLDSGQLQIHDGPPAPREGRIWVQGFRDAGSGTHYTEWLSVPSNHPPYYLWRDLDVRWPYVEVTVEVRTDAEARALRTPDLDARLRAHTEERNAWVRRRDAVLISLGGRGIDPAVIAEAVRTRLPEPRWEGAIRQQKTVRAFVAPSPTREALDPASSFLGNSGASWEEWLVYRGANSAWRLVNRAEGSQVQLFPVEESQKALNAQFALQIGALQVLEAFRLDLLVTKEPALPGLDQALKLVDEVLLGLDKAGASPVEQLFVEEM